ncbi:L-type lectin-domain containing protein [Latilactobacillus sakei]
MRINKTIQFLVLGISLLLGILVVVRPTEATIDPVPAHITNIENLFAPPLKASDSELPVDGVTVINPAANNQSGAIWSNPDNRIDLTKSFDSSMLLNFGDSGVKAADGMAFVMHGDSRGTSVIQLNGSGQQLGVWAEPQSSSSAKPDLSTAIQNSFAVEFDTFNNKNWDAKNFKQNWLDFSVTQLTTNHIASGFPAQAGTYTSATSGLGILADYTTILNHGNLYELPKNTYLSDGKWHQFRVTWDPDKHLLSYYFDTVLRGTATITDLNKTFGGTSVYWGFTGKTGGSNELNQVAFEKISNIPTTSQNYKVYHENGDALGAEVTKDNPAKPLEELKGVLTINNEPTSGSDWKQVGVRYMTEGTDDSQGVSYVADDLAINDKLVSKNKVSTGLFKTPAIDLNGNALTPHAATESDFFGTVGDNKYSTGVNMGDIAKNSTSKIQFTLTAFDPTPTDGTTNLGRNYKISLDGKMARDSTEKAIYVTSVPKITLDKKWTDPTKEKPIALDKNQPIDLTGSWSQSSATGKIDSHALGTLHYAIDDGAEKTIAQNNVGSKLVSGIPTVGLSLNDTHKLTLYMTNAGYNEKSAVVTVYFKLKGGTLLLDKVKDEIGFEPVTVGKNTINKRDNTDWAPTVADTRGTGSRWDLYASSTGLTRTTDHKQLDGGLVYVDGQKTTDVTATPQKIASKTTTSDDDITPIKWDDNQGILLKVNAGAYVGDYTGTIDWTLGNTPAP